MAQNLEKVVPCELAQARKRSRMTRRWILKPGMLTKTRHNFCSTKSLLFLILVKGSSSNSFFSSFQHILNIGLLRLLELISMWNLLLRHSRNYIKSVFDISWNWTDTPNDLTKTPHLFGKWKKGGKWVLVTIPEAKMRMATVRTTMRVRRATSRAMSVTRSSSSLARWGICLTCKRRTHLRWHPMARF